MAIHTNEDGTVKELTLGGSGSVVINGIDKIYQGTEFPYGQYTSTILSIQLSNPVGKYSLLLFVCSRLQSGASANIYGANTTIISVEALLTEDSIKIVLASSTSNSTDNKVMIQIQKSNPEDTTLQYSVVGGASGLHGDWTIYGIF